MKSSFFSHEEQGVFVVPNNYLNWSWRKTAALFFSSGLICFHIYSKLKLRKILRESNFACWINKELVNLRFETNSVKFNNFTPLRIKLTPLNLEPFEVYKCGRLCTLPSSAPSLNKLQNLWFSNKTLLRCTIYLWKNSVTLMSKFHARPNNSFLNLGQALKPVILGFETCFLIPQLVQ